VGHPPVQAVAGAIAVEWSEDAPADLDRFAQLLQADISELASIVAGEILSRIQLLSDFPKLGRPIATRPEYRQLVLRVRGASYVFQYRYDGTRLVMLRVFHGREQRP
jgi:plasmid stabilization system protein ParE